jgi:hypothetical protein
VKIRLAIDLDFIAAVTVVVVVVSSRGRSSGGYDEPHFSLAAALPCHHLTP